MSLSWHYDLNQLVKPGRLLLPDVNAYVGLSDRTVLGFGTPSLPMLVNHLSFAAYSRRTVDEYLSAWILVKVISTNNNPFVEFGGTYCGRDGSSWESISLGVGVFQPGQWLFGRAHGRLPVSLFAAYGLSGKDFAVDATHRFGQNKQLIKNMFPIWPPTKDTLVAFPAESVVVLQHYSPLSYHSSSLGFCSLAGDTVVVSWGKIPYADAFYEWEMEFQEWLGDELKIAWVNEDWAIIDSEALSRAVRLKMPIVITRAPEALVQRIEKIKSLIRDNSIGLATRFWPK